MSKLELLAENEHSRWARWQNYLHSFLKWNGAAWELPNDKKERWQRQIETPYSQLSEEEKDSDRKEARQVLAMADPVGELLEKLPPYIHLPEEDNRLYFILTRDISGKWLAAYFTHDEEARFYHAVTEETPQQALRALSNEISPSPQLESK